ncbi:MAG TPA: cyclic peptide export ABC transporter [Nostocaceae cyanobacterium]|nr:cyclic peptide export ABC transporter [Nostocaceae cyanobacterium]
MDIIRLLLSSSWKVLLLAATASLISGVTTTGILALINNSRINYSSLNTPLIWTFIGLCFCRFIGNLMTQTLLISFSQEAILNLRMMISQKILASQLYHLEQLGKHKILATLTDDIQSLSNTALILPRFCVNAVILITCLIYLCWLSPVFFMIILLFIILGITSYQLMSNKAHSNMILAREQQDKLFNNFRAITDGTKDLMLHSEKRAAFFKNLLANAESYKQENVIGMSMFALASSWAQVMLFVAIGIVIFILPLLYNTQSQVLSSYVLIITYLILPLDAIINSLSSFNRSFVALKKIKSLDLNLINSSVSNVEAENLKLPTSSPKRIEENLLISKDLESPFQRLELIDIAYTYQNETEQYLFGVGPINLTFYSGEIVFIIGGNGSGKSTFIKLLTALYSPNAGKIIINGKLINAEECEWYRQYFSVVFADFYLFDNLLNLGKTISHAQVYDYLVKLQLNDKVQVKDGILSTTALSQGQRKRLALLTAYLEDRAIYIFDEWAADQDPIFKNIFYTEILPDLKNRGKLVIAVTHDEQYYHLSDRVIKLNNGNVEYDKLQKQPLYEDIEYKQLQQQLS